jgi:hypothetical protein
MTLPTNYMDGQTIHGADVNSWTGAINGNILALSNVVVGEDLTLQVDGTNLIFTTANPFIPGTTAVWWNGLRESAGVGYAEAGNTLVFTDAPAVGDVLRVDYQKAIRSVGLDGQGVLSSTAEGL